MSTGCQDKSCIPETEVSEDCYKVKCYPKCERLDCNIPECPSYRPEELVCRLRDAVVEVHSEFILLGGTGSSPITGATSGTPLAPNVRTDVFLNGNGFFIKGHYIIAPAHLVLLPPSLTSVVNRYPLIDPSNTALGQIKDQMVRASRILVSVFNVNGKGHSFIYEAELVGVDGAGDIAVLRINYKKQWNLCNPCIEPCHPYFSFGESRASVDGEKVYLIGDYISHPIDRRLFNAVGAISEGLLSDHRFLDYSGFALSEAVLVSASAYAFSSGMPILNAQGQVIGMQTTDVAGVSPMLVFPQTTLSVTGGTVTIPYTSLGQTEGFGLVSGPSEYFMRRVVKTIIKGTCSKKYNAQLETICDPVGSYYRYRKAYAGIAYQVFNPQYYDVTVDYTSVLPVDPFLMTSLPRVRLNAQGDFMNSPSCKEIIGIMVVGLAGLNPNDILGVTNGFWYVPGGTAAAPLVPYLPPSPFLGRLLPGDVITHMQGVPLGDIGCQIAPSLITWRLSHRDQLEICYRRGGNILNGFPNDTTENYDTFYTITVCLEDFPRLMDYPWYRITFFPLLRDRGFTFPAGQDSTLQFPRLELGAPFHPAF